MRFYIGIASVALFNTVFTLIKPYLQNITYWKGPKYAMRILKEPLCKKCPYLEFFWSAFSRIWAKYGEILPYSVRMRENKDQKNSEYG